MFGKKTETYGSHGENPSSYRESEKFKNGLQELERISEIHLHAKVTILSVALGLKDASEFEVVAQDAQVQDIENMLSALGVFFHEDKESSEALLMLYYQNGGEPNDYNFIRYIVGNTPETINAAIEHGSYFSRDHEAFGKAMDYPPTAVKAFSESRMTGDKSNLMPNSEENRELTEEERRFAFFTFSKEHFEEEVAWLEQLIAGVKEYSPVIYQQIMGEQYK
jgi:hypothetical protein